MTIPILPVEAIRAAEAQANEAGISNEELMQRAGRALAARLAALLDATGAPPDQRRVTFLIGPGNNGGDGLVAGRLLAEAAGAQVRFYLLKARPAGDPYLRAVQDAGHVVALADDDSRFRVLKQMIGTSLIVVDALFGIGARLPLDADTRKLLKAARGALETPAGDGAAVFAGEALPPPQRAHVLAVDCPSGIDCDSGAADETVLPADETMTMIAARPGLFAYPAAESAGRLSVASLELPALAALKDPAAQLVTASDTSGWLPPRVSNSHKGTHGRVLIVGGSANYPGAPVLAARAAYRAGAGLVTAAVPDPLVDVLAGSAHEVTWLPLPHDLAALTADGAPLIQEQAANAGALVLGMGIGRDPATRAFIQRLLGGHAAQPGMGFTPTAGPASGSNLPPLVIDADALFHLASLPNWPSLLPPGTILTPHPGEMARLCGRTTEEVNANRWALAREMAVAWKVTLLLKGAHTVIADPGGQLLVLPFKTSALATAGTGDVLAGMIGALRAAGVEPLHAAAAAGWLHGMAGVISAARLGSERAVCAGDVIEAIPAALASVNG